MQLPAPTRFAVGWKLSSPAGAEGEGLLPVGNLVGKFPLTAVADEESFPALCPPTVVGWMLPATVVGLPNFSPLPFVGNLPSTAVAEVGESSARQDDPALVLPQLARTGKLMTLAVAKLPQPLAIDMEQLLSSRAVARADEVSPLAIVGMLPPPAVVDDGERPDCTDTPAVLPLLAVARVVPQAIAVEGEFSRDFHHHNK